MVSLTVDPATTALLVMDMQNDQVGGVTGAGEDRGIVERLARVIDAARGSGIAIVYIVARFRAGHPEAHPRNRFQMHNREVNRLVEGSEGAAIHDGLAPQEGDLVVTKRRINGFFQTDLDILLRAHGIEHLVCTGIATGGVVLSTIRYAADLDYTLTALEDCCADPDPDRQDCLFRLVLPMQAEIANAADFLDALN